jgi:death-on-curing protein
MTEPIWLDENIANAIHAAMIAKHGGSAGTRDAGLLASALERPRNRWAYEQPTLAELAAAYGFGIARNHPFIDGNKRVAFMAAYTFLGLNGYRLTAPEAEAAVTFLALAAGELAEVELADWIAANLVEI